MMLSVLAVCALGGVGLLLLHKLLVMGARHNGAKQDHTQERFHGSTVLVTDALQHKVVGYVESVEGPAAEQWQWRLLWRGSAHGFSAAAFHSRCDGRENTVTVVRNDKHYVFGGYTPLPWHSRGGYATNCGGRTMVFTLERAGAPAEGVIHCTDHQYCICGYPSYGPAFHGCDSLFLCDCCHENPASHSNPLFSRSDLPPAQPHDAFFAGSCTGWLVEDLEVWCRS
eukprot:TRINITY_DN4065_c0_g1_i1.p1 TRINITY_DN4065_c0_g1~~TRINITY_DN4065_c0_g1_i1.p1  ORF type:complete len:226 (-),score=44.47 TRINITY_DN4065_c0_g1_i1:87-764(-)